MFYCGRDEMGEPIYVARTDAQRMRQHYILMPAAAESESPGRPRARQDARAGNNPQERPYPARNGQGRREDTPRRDEANRPPRQHWQARPEAGQPSRGYRPDADERCPDRRNNRTAGEDRSRQAERKNGRKGVRRD